LRLMERQKPGVLHNDLAACNDYMNGDVAVSLLACPALIICGNKDVMTHPKASAKLASRMSDVEIVTLNGAGHSMMTEQPIAVLDALCNFITRDPDRLSR